MISLDGIEFLITSTVLNVHYFEVTQSWEKIGVTSSSVLVLNRRAVVLLKLCHFFSVWLWRNQFTNLVFQKRRRTMIDRKLTGLQGPGLWQNKECMKNDHTK